MLVFVGVGMVVFEVVIVVMIQRVTPSARSAGCSERSTAPRTPASWSVRLLHRCSCAVLGLDGSLVAIAVALLVIGTLATRPLVVIGRLADQRQRSLAPTVDVLAKLAIFEGASLQSLERIAADVGELVVDDGTVVIRQGDQADNLYVVIRGSLKVSVDGREVGQLGDGDWFGEIGLLGRRPRTRRSRSSAETVLWRIPGSTFLSVLEDAGAPPSALLDSIADRLSTHR